MPATTVTQVSEKLQDIKLVNSKLENDSVGSYKNPFYADRVLHDDGLLTLTSDELEGVKYKDFAPTWDTNKKFPPYRVFNFRDRGLDADPSLRQLFPPNGSHETKTITPKFGTEVSGVQLSKLSNAAKDELALYVAQRGLLVFRDQDLAEKGVEFNSEFGEYFGPLHIHQASGAPKDHPEIHLVYRASNLKPESTTLIKHISTTAWHSDVSFEKQPPGITFLAILQGPESGGDTVFSDNEEAFNRLSPEFQKIIEKLYAVHSSFEQAEGSLKNGGILRRDPVKNIHPIVRKHPVTGKKAIFVNKQFTRDIVGLKKEESDLILNFLYNHIGNSLDVQARAKWEPGTVVVWDNRNTTHTALQDWSTVERRHLYRLASRADVPSI